MSGYIPFEPGDPEQRVEIVFDDYPCVLRVRWNSRDAAWYMDVYEADGVAPIALGLKLVLGAEIGALVNHRLFDGAFFLFDESGTGVDAGLNDLGVRVRVIYLTAVDRLLARSPLPTDIPTS